MKFKINWIFAVVVGILLLCLSSEVIEGFKGHELRRRPNYRGMKMDGRHSSGAFLHRAPHNPPQHSWKRGPETGIYDGTPHHWGGWRKDIHPNIQNYFPSTLYRSTCKSGCGHTGKSVGCINPSNLPGSCIFASDCYGC